MEDILIMRTKRDVLEKELTIMISEYAKNRHVKMKVADIFKGHNLLAGDANSILMLLTPINTISQVMLYIFTKSLYEATSEERINPEKFFTELEIKEGDNWKADIEGKSKYPIVFKNVEKINSDMWVTYMTAQEIAELYSRRVIIYNPETQRALKKKEYKDKIIEEIDINKTSIQEIKKDILSSKFISNYITFNIMQSGEEQFEYNEKEKTLTIYAGETNILDGFHRSLGMIYAVQENPNVEFRTGVSITNFDLDKARRYIVQEDKKNKMNKKYIKSLNSDSISNLIVKKINENSNSYLKGLVSFDDFMIKKGKAFVAFDILADAIEYTFEPKERLDIVKYSKRIIDGLNHIIELKQDLIKVAVEQTTWAYYICLIYATYEMGNWEDIILELLDNDSLNSKINISDIKSINKQSMKKLVDIISENINNN